MSSINVLPEGTNFLIIQTDQQRFPMDWPEGWAMENLPAYSQLTRSGISFANAFTATCMCTPSRAALHASLYPARTGVYQTFGPPEPPPNDGYDVLDPTLPNFNVLATRGYTVTYKGKWHLSMPDSRQERPVHQNWSASDSMHLQTRYGYGGWNPPDAGNSLHVMETLGGGSARANNDTRTLFGPSHTTDAGFEDGLVSCIERIASSGQPFCLFASFVNPHDIWVFPEKYSRAGYSLDKITDRPFDQIKLPSTWQASLDSKPLVQGQFRNKFDGGPIRTERNALVYVWAYAYLQWLVDTQIKIMLDILDEHGLTDNTLIVRLADHGEMGLSYGLREKFDNCYEQSIRIPLIFSHPNLPQNLITKKFASTIDILPTIASLAGVDVSEYNFDGEDLTQYLIDPIVQPLVGDVAHFTYDDDKGVGITTDVHHIRMVRDDRYKYAVYFDEAGTLFQFEMYDLHDAAGESNNLAYWKSLLLLQKKDPAAYVDRLDLLQTYHKKLTKQMLRYGTMPIQFIWPEKHDYTMRWQS